jgi:hypothetical protein
VTITVPGLFYRSVSTAVETPLEANTVRTLLTTRDHFIKSVSGCQDNYINDEKGEHKNANKKIRKDYNKDNTKMKLSKMIPNKYLPSRQEEDAVASRRAH